MKALKFSPLEALLLTVVVSTTSAFAQPVVEMNRGGGHGSGNGGDMLVSEFTGSARLMAREFALQPGLTACPDSKAFAAMINQATVFSSFNVIKEGKERDAWNERAEKTIEISRSRLYNANDPKNYLAVVLHEYLGLMGLEETNDFRLSHGCIQELEIAGVQLEKLRYRANPLSGPIEAFSKGEIGLQCYSSNMAPQRIEIGNRNKKGKFHYRISELRPNGLYARISSIGYSSKTQNEWLRSWTVHYDVRSGNTRVSLVAMIADIVFGGDVSTKQTEVELEFIHGMAASGEFSLSYIPQSENQQRSYFATCTPYSTRSYAE